MDEFRFWKGGFWRDHLQVGVRKCGRLRGEFRILAAAWRECRFKRIHSFNVFTPPLQSIHHSFFYPSHPLFSAPPPPPSPQGKPYHISALYLVDLKRFRSLAAGDQLRIVYDSLSKDPNSLANLDHDLPNYAQHSIPIFSLQQEWLWCESWCGNETKKRVRSGAGGGGGR